MGIFNKSKYFLCCLIFSYLPLAQADFLTSALSGHCKGKEVTILQETTIEAPKDINLKELNSDAVKDLYMKNGNPIQIDFKCNGIILKSEYEIEAGFNNKPKGPVDVIFTDERWVGFYEKYPDSKGILKISQVGYSKDHTYAIIYKVSSCNSFCGYADFFQYKFVNGIWVHDKTVFVSKS